MIYKFSFIFARRYRPASQAIVFSNLKDFLKVIGDFDLFMQCLKPIFSFDASKFPSYYDGWFAGCFSAKMGHWSSLGPMGYYPLNFTDYLTAINPFDPKHYCVDPLCLQCSHISPPPHPKKFVKPLWDMTLELLDKRCVAPTSLPPTGHYFVQPKPNSSKVRAIFNGVYANAIEDFWPKTFSLPNFENVKPWLRTYANIFFHRTDVQNYFWSFILPEPLQNKFIYSVVELSGDIRNFSLLWAPFGWDFIPYIANRTMHSIIDNLSSDLFQQLVFYDDILSLSLSKPICEFNTSQMRAKVESAGFIIHPPGSDKSSLFAPTTTHFVGKLISSGSNPQIANLPTTNDACLFAVIIGTAYKLSIKQLQSITGTLLWGTAHNKLGKPFLYGLHKLCALSNHKRLWIRKYTRLNCIQAYFMSALP